ncbi:hypothetical protein ABTP16_06555, partial [Acinetobacter baumannii]
VVVVVVDLIEISQVKMHLETVMDFLEDTTSLQKMEMVERLLLKGVHTVDLVEVEDSVVEDVVVTVMMRLLRVSVLEGCMTGEVGLGAAMTSNVKVVVVETGEQLQMI